MVSNLLKIMVAFIFKNTFPMESACFGGENWLFGAKPCREPGAEFSNLVMSLVVYTSGAR